MMLDSKTVAAIQKAVDGAPIGRFVVVVWTIVFVAAIASFDADTMKWSWWWLYAPWAFLMGCFALGALVLLKKRGVVEPPPGRKPFKAGESQQAAPGPPAEERNAGDAP